MEEENTFTREFTEQPLPDEEILTKTEIPSHEPAKEKSTNYWKYASIALAILLVILVIAIPVGVTSGNRNNVVSSINDSPDAAPFAGPAVSFTTSPTPVRAPIASSAAPIQSPVAAPTGGGTTPTVTTPTATTPTATTPTATTPTATSPTTTTPTATSPTATSPTATIPTVVAPTPTTVVESDGRCCAPGFTGLKGKFPDCDSFYQCTDGVVSTVYQSCAPGTVFDETRRACSFPDGPCLADACGQPDFRPTAAPVAPTPPTNPPVIPATPAPVTQPPTAPPKPTTPNPTFAAGTFPIGEQVVATLDSVEDGINDNLLRSLTPTNTWQPSTVYRYQGMIDALKYMYQDGVANLKFYMGEDGGENGVTYGLVNVAAFLGQSMQESIQYDVCDENSWDLINGRYPISNSCGQLGQSYQDYKCPAGEEDMACEIDPEMTLTATTHAKWYGAPAPMKCGPKSVYPQTGYWNYNCQCNRPWANPPQLCTVYEGQQAGCEINDEPVANGSGRTDVEGCCWWGRGVIQTTGPCNFGKLNYYLGKRAADEGRPSRYPEYDFCKNPQLICSSAQYPELKWIAGMFYWISSVQEYKEEGFDYYNALKDFVDTGMTSDAFIDSVSGIVNRGCAFPPCATGDVDKKLERRESFRSALTEFGVLSR